MDTYDVKQLGATGDGIVVDTDIMQLALNLCKKSGGEIIIPKGKYLCSTLEIFSNTVLRLEEGAEIIGIQDATVYHEVPGFSEEPHMKQALIIANQAKNIKICGNGVINGRGDRAHFKPQGYTDSGASDARPMLLCFFKCKNIMLEDVMFLNSPAWGVVFKACEYIKLFHIRIRNRSNINNDGIDIDGCSRVYINNCDIDSGDDAICLKSACGYPCRDVFISNCRLCSNTSGFKLGTSSRGLYQNIILHHCIITDTDMGAIKILMVDGGTLENVHISDVIIYNSEGPIFIRLGERDWDYGGKPAYNPKQSELKNIFISNIQFFANSKGQKDRCGIMITGTEKRKVENIELKNIEISLPGGICEIPQEPEEAEKSYPEQFFFGVLPSCGIFIRHANQVTLNNLRFKFLKSDQRPLLWGKDINELYIRSLRCGAENKIQLQECHNVDINDSKVVDLNRTEETDK